MIDFHPSRPHLLESQITNTHRFWQRTLEIITPLCRNRYIRYWKRYTDGVVQQAADRDRKHINSIESYFPLRRLTIGTPPAYGLIDLYLNIPDYMIEHPTVQRLSDLATDMISMCNDLYSYNIEQARGDGDHNLVTVVMNDLGLSVEHAYEWIGRHHDDVLNEFLTLYANLPWFPYESEITNAELREYVYGLGDWVRANERWSFEVNYLYHTPMLS
jgi:hypothetical protein